MRAQGYSNEVFELFKTSGLHYSGADECLKTMCDAPRNGACRFGGGEHTVIKAYLVPQSRLNLLIFSRLDDYGISITFENGKCILSARKSDNRVFQTLRKKDSNCLFTAKIKRMEI